MADNISPIIGIDAATAKMLSSLAIFTPSPTIVYVGVKALSD